MNRWRNAFLLLLMAAFATSCSVISQDIREQAEPSVPFTVLLQETENYLGKAVILGGYILETKNLPKETTIKVLQAPLGFGEEPKSKDKSEGRFMVVHGGFLDPEVYTKGRKMTVAGNVLGTVVEEIDESSLQYLKIQSREIYLWSEKKYYYPVSYWDRWYWAPWYDPYFYGWD